LLFQKLSNDVCLVAVKFILNSFAGRRLLITFRVADDCREVVNLQRDYFAAAAPATQLQVIIGQLLAGVFLVWSGLEGTVEDGSCPPEDELVEKMQLLPPDEVVPVRYRVYPLIVYIAIDLQTKGN
jgi:hypothetical protein